jgi:hypothetical protein
VLLARGGLRKSRFTTLEHGAGKELCQQNGPLRALPQSPSVAHIGPGSGKAQTPLSQLKPLHSASVSHGLTQ